ncbi:5-(carboxyamino)imidazole ribonucleotide synthase [soil metagenome]
MSSGKNVIGVVGGGQLARMLTLAAKPLGFHVIVIDTKPDCPAAQVGAEEIIAEPGDESALKRLAERADYLTVEFEELFDIKALETLAQSGKMINPAPATIQLIKDKFYQKQFLEDNKIPVGPFAEITGLAQAKKLLEQYGGKMMIKTRYGGYDGRGNAVVASSMELTKALEAFSGQALYAEALVNFKKELAIMITRGLDGSVTAHPVVETVHVRNICTEVIAPAPVNQKIRAQAEAVALQVAELLEGAGTFGIEMFLTKEGKVLVNEIAPRVHNSGHYTIEATRTSQFEQHVRAVTGLPLGDPSMVVPAAVMINILGESNSPARLRGLDKVLDIPHTSVHIYGKSPTRIDRKMGHITATGKTIDEAKKRARSARKILSI